MFPDRFTALFGVELATDGRAAALLFPRVDAESSPDVVGDAVQALGDDDFMSGATEDRYPDIFELAGGVDGGGLRSARGEVSARLAVLPHRTVRRSHDVPASVAALRKAAEAVRRQAPCPTDPRTLDVWGAVSTAQLDDRRRTG